MYWIDFTDFGMEGKWVTFSTGKNEYTNWNSGQPDNAGGRQDCAVNNYANRAGYWADGGCTASIQVMCEASSKFCSDIPFRTLPRSNEISNILFIIAILLLTYREIIIGKMFLLYI